MLIWWRAIWNCDTRYRQIYILYMVYDLWYVIDDMKNDIVCHKMRYDMNIVIYDKRYIMIWYMKHDDVIKWKHFPRYWPFVCGIHWSPVNSLHKGQWRVALMFSSICAWINEWVNNREAGDLRRHRVQYDLIVMNVKWYRIRFYMTWYDMRYDVIVTRCDTIFMLFKSLTVFVLSAIRLPVNDYEKLKFKSMKP